MCVDQRSPERGINVDLSERKMGLRYPAAVTLRPSIATVKFKTKY